MSAHVAIELIAAPSAFWRAGFVIRMKGTEQLAAGMCVQLVPSDWVFHFETIEAARDFCWACNFTWSVRCG